MFLNFGTAWDAGSTDEGTKIFDFTGMVEFEGNRR